MQTQMVHTLLTSFISRLKAPTACVLISMGLVACGGGAGGGYDYQINEKSPETSSPTTNDDQATNTPNQVDAGDSETDSAGEPTPTISADDETGSDDISGNNGSDDSSVSDTGDDGSITEDNTDSATPGETLVDVSGGVVLEWDAPQSRENGDYLELNEIGGYELRYREEGSSDYEIIPLPGGDVEYHEFENLEGRYEFAIAAYDTNGLYSEFVSLSPALTN